MFCFLPGFEAYASENQKNQEVDKGKKKKRTDKRETVVNHLPVSSKETNCLDLAAIYMVGIPWYLCSFEPWLAKGRSWVDQIGSCTLYRFQMSKMNPVRRSLRSST